MKKKILFICSQNRLRSPTAEQVYAKREDLLVSSAGLNNDATNRVSGELLEWADIIFVMEKSHINRLRKKFRKHLKDQRLICLDIPDIYEYMEPALIEVFESKLPRYVGFP
jgi:predicted protein tyrosine phosphatase